MFRYHLVHNDKKDSLVTIQCRKMRCPKGCEIHILRYLIAELKMSAKQESMALVSMHFILTKRPSRLRDKTSCFVQLVSCFTQQHGALVVLYSCRRFNPGFANTYWRFQCFLHDRIIKLRSNCLKCRFRRHCLASYEILMVFVINKFHLSKLFQARPMSLKIWSVIISITKFSIVIGSLRAYMHVIGTGSSRCPITGIWFKLFAIGYL